MRDVPYLYLFLSFLNWSAKIRALFGISKFSYELFTYFSYLKINLKCKNVKKHHYIIELFYK